MQEPSHRLCLCSQPACSIPATCLLHTSALPVLRWPSVPTCPAPCLTPLQAGSIPQLANTWNQRMRMRTYTFFSHIHFFSVVQAVVARQNTQKRSATRGSIGGLPGTSSSHKSNASGVSSRHAAPPPPPPPPPPKRESLPPCWHEVDLP